MPKSKVLFLGLGRMGFYMSAHLSKSKNIELYIYNRSKKKRNDWLNVYKAKKFDFKNSDNLSLILLLLVKMTIPSISNKKFIKIFMFP